MPWQKQLQAAPQNTDELVAALKLKSLATATAGTTQFPLKMTASYLQRIHPGKADDPLLRQIFPFAEEDTEHHSMLADPVGDQDSIVLPGLLHKYSGRVLLITTGACPIHCRYCFRRHFPYPEHTISKQKLEQVVNYVQADTSIHEVILSGGDPLMLSDDKLRSILQKLQTVQHLTTVRIHTRTPIALPQRILEANLDWLQQTSLRTVVVLHANHAQEIDHQVQQAIKDLSDTETILLNQSVLLRGVNDSVEVLTKLSEVLFTSGVLPYYLHMLDKVTGARHFEVLETDAKKIHNAMQQSLPGYLVPKLVKEISGEKSKTWLI